MRAANAISFSAAGWVVAASIISGCRKESVQTPKQISTAQHSGDTRPSQEGTTFTYTQALDGDPKGLAEGVYNGHMPWRLNPETTAQYYIMYGLADKAMPNDIKESLQKLSNVQPKILAAQDPLHRTAQWETSALRVRVSLMGYNGPGNEVVWQSSGCTINRLD